jgi:hypothetical protein
MQGSLGVPLSASIQQDVVSAIVADFQSVHEDLIRQDADVDVGYYDDIGVMILERTAGSTHYEFLRTDVWHGAHPDFVRQYRVQERRDRTDR